MEESVVVKKIRKRQQIRSPHQYSIQDFSRHHHDLTAYHSDKNLEYHVYPKRWIVLMTCFLLALTNTIMWMFMATITTQATIFYCEDGQDCQVPFITNQIFQLLAIITGVPGMYITDSFGIKVSLWGATFLNFLGSLLRLGSGHPFVPTSILRLTLLYTGSVLSASAQSCYLILPTKIAEAWFAPKQRSLANVLLFVANPAGAMLATLLPGLFFDSDKTDTFTRDSYGIFYLHLVVAITTGLNVVCCLFVTTSLPPSPPSASGDVRCVVHHKFLPSILTCIKSNQFRVEMFLFAMGFSLFWTLALVMPDILTTQGYIGIGYIISVSLMAGTLFTLVVGHVADLTKSFTEIIKFLVCSFAVVAVVTRVFLNYASDGHFLFELGVTVLFGLLGVFSIPVFPIGSELGVETTFPVYEGTSSGILVMSGQLAMLIFYGIVQFAKQLDLFYEFDHTSMAGNWKLVCDIFVFFSVLTAIIALVFLHPVYMRMEAEKNAKEVIQSLTMSLNQQTPERSNRSGQSTESSELASFSGSSRSHDTEETSSQLPFIDASSEEVVTNNDKSIGDNVDKTCESNGVRGVLICRL